MPAALNQSIRPPKQRDAMASRVAGAGDPDHVKCLHAQLAFALSEGGNPVGDWIMERSDASWPAACCAEVPE